MDEKRKEMIKHLNNIINKIELEKKCDNNKYIDDVYSNVSNIIEYLNSNDKIDSKFLKSVKDTSNIIYSMNLDCSFSKWSDYISTEYYAFEFVLQEYLKEGGIING